MESRTTTTAGVEPKLPVPRHLSWFPLLAMRYEEGRGRFLVAAQAIPMGETVCMSAPYCRAVTGIVKRMVCSHCYKVNTNRLPHQCARCQEVYFCSAECRDKNMEQHAPYECNAFKRMTRTRGRDKLDLDDVRVIVNMLNKRYLEREKAKRSQTATEVEETTKDEASLPSDVQPTQATQPNQTTDESSTQAQSPLDSISQDSKLDEIFTAASLEKPIATPPLDSTNPRVEEHPNAIVPGVNELCFEDVAALVGELDMLPNALERKAFEEAAAFLLRIIDEPLKEGLDQESVKGLFLKSRFNRFGKWSKKGTAMGFGVFPFVSYFNHSCIPNLRRYQGVRAIRPIEAGEELCISYTDLHLTTDDRRMVLRDYFGFTCMCQRCTDVTEASDKYVMEKSCPSRFCQELLLPLIEYDCQVFHCRHCGIINNKHRPKHRP